MSFFDRLFNRKPTPAPAPCQHNPLDLGNGFTIETRDEFGYKVAEVVIPLGSWVSFTYAGREVFRIDQNGGRSI